MFDALPTSRAEIRQYSSAALSRFPHSVLGIRMTRYRCGSPGFLIYPTTSISTAHSPVYPSSGVMAHLAFLLVPRLCSIPSGKWKESAVIFQQLLPCWCRGLCMALPGCSSSGVAFMVSDCVVHGSSAVSWHAAFLVRWPVFPAGSYPIYALAGRSFFRARFGC